ncbi:LysR family transcriptional regulator [Roseibium sp. SCPC15]|uniref:LysR family transcriptional regulator n=1 Tax=Roseibium sp. SCP15 TaxID=3141376 RepID=UPI00333CE8CC
MSRFPSADRLLEFKAIVECGSINAAAEHLQLTRPTLSRRLAELETQLSVRLLQRTTRELFPTPAGNELYLRAVRIAADVEATWCALQQLDDEPSGPLRISVPESELAAVPLFTDYAAEFPKVDLDVVVTNNKSDLRAAGVDVALVFGEIRDPSLIAKRIYTSRNIAMATQAYLDQHGMPETLEQLGQHECIVLRNSDGVPETRWPRSDGGHVEVQPRLLTSGFRLMVQAVHAGLGIGLLPERELLKNSDLVSLFPNIVQRDDQFSLVYVEREFQLPHVRAFIERSNVFWRHWLMNW